MFKKILNQESDHHQARDSSGKKRRITINQ